MIIIDTMKIKNKILEILHNSPLEVSINLKLRYEPIVAKLKELKKTHNKLKVLEVGSGSKGVTRFFKHHVTGIDVEFQKHKNKYLKEILIPPNKKYTFKNNEFDVVVSVDTIEHIPRKYRKKTLKEMLRVSKRFIMLTCPFAITEWDLKILANWNKNTPTYKNTREHVDCGIPHPNEIENIILLKKYKMKMVYGEHPALSYYIKFMERNIIGKAIARTVLKIFMPLFRLIKGTTRRYYFIEKI